MMARNLELKQFTMLQEYLLNTNRCAAKPAAFLFLFLCKLQRIIVKISVVVYAISSVNHRLVTIDGLVRSIKIVVLGQ